MFHLKPKNLSTVLSQVSTDIYQLCVFEEKLTIDEQIKGMTLIGNEIIRLYPNINLFITINPHPAGYVYASLDIPDEDLENNPSIEDVVNSLIPSVECIIMVGKS